MVEAVIFDLDGTLLDTAPDLYRALCDTARDYGIQSPSFEEFKKHIGGGAYGFIAPFFPSEVWEEALLKLRSYYLNRYLCRDTKPFEGIRETLEILKERGLKLAVATNKITEGALRVLKITDLLHYFDTVVGRDLPREHKPSKEHILFICKRLNLEPSKTIVVGDRLDDILSAKGAGAKSALALWGYIQPLPPEVKPDFLLKTPKELLGILENG
ncbi:MAG: HAD family hydrolase [Aquificaceae bacterium]|nr:MAG: HAD family hydrolase [Aquificaceae bacterium]